jgi:hypothetical protein
MGLVSVDKNNELQSYSSQQGDDPESMMSATHQ